LLQVLIYSPDGRCLFKYLAYESGLGVKTVAWSPCGQFLAVGSYDQAVRTLNHLTWKTFGEFTHAASIRSPCNASIYKVILSVSFIIHHISIAAPSRSIYVILIILLNFTYHIVCRKLMTHGSLICQSYV
jgi:WD40 repeat protein